jgi:3-hydroxyacyl-CoA dehydrogenase
MKIENSVILITGGASGIGENIALYFYENKAIVYICDMNAEKGNKLEEDTRKKIRFIKCDITNEEQVKSMIDTIKKEQGRLDVVINSAGIVWAEVIASEKTSHKPDNFERVMKVNAFGSFMVSKYAAQLMCEKADNKAECNGVIIMISSVAGIEGQKGQTAYSGSKGAIIGMTLPMSRDLGKYKIRVNTIAPGMIETPMTAGFRDTKVGKMILDATPLKTFGKPLNISLTSEFIIKNDFVNGTVIRVDGGVRFPHF